MGVKRLREAVPVIVGVGELADRVADVDLASAKEPLVLLEEAVGLAARDAGPAGELLSDADTILVVNVAAWVYRDLPGRLAERIGATPTHTLHSDWGGNWPTKLVDEAAARIAAGESRIAVVCGGDVFRTVERAMRGGIPLPWTPPADQGVQVQDVISPIAYRHGLRWPTQIYPLYENAFRRAHGLSFEESQRWTGEMWSDMSRIAARNPVAWHPTPLSPEQVVTASADNRMICFPYLKLMNAYLSVNQAAAVVLTDTETARRLGIPEERWAYPWGGAGADDPGDVLARVSYDRAPAMEASLDDALSLAGVSIHDVEVLELYSCFPCVPKMASTLLGLDRSRAVSMTGGLTFFGGAGNGYMLHAIGATTNALRRGEGSAALLYGQGGLVTKHHAMVMGIEPPSGGYPVGDETSRQRRIDALEAPPLAAEPSGPGSIETYTVVYGRGGEPESGIVIGRLRTGERFVANTRAGDRAALDLMVRPDDGPIGREGKVETNADGQASFDIA